MEEARRGAARGEGEQWFGDARVGFVCGGVGVVGVSPKGRRVGTGQQRPIPFGFGGEAATDPLTKGLGVGAGGACLGEVIVGLVLKKRAVCAGVPFSRCEVSIEHVVALNGLGNL